MCSGLPLSEINAFPDAASRSRWRSKILEERSQRIETYRGKMLGKTSLWIAWRNQLPQGEQVESIALSRLRLWASLLDPDFEHSQHVARLALQLYDGLPAVPGTESREERGMLQLAALAARCGFVEEKAKPITRPRRSSSCDWIRPWDGAHEKMKMVAAVARYHRGALPRAGQKVLMGFTVRQRQIAIRLAAVLRLANAFDADRDGRIERLACERKNGFLLIRAQAYNPRDRIAETIAGSRHLLETVYRRPVLIKPLRGGG